MEAMKAPEGREFWERMHAWLVSFHRRHGHCDVPRGGEMDMLNWWLNRQRMRARSGSLRGWRLQQLMELGAVKPGHEAIWLMRFRELRRFRKRFGHIRVPKDPQWRSLFVWLMNQRLAFRRRTLAAARVQWMRQFGFSLDPSTEQWDAMYEGMARFIQEHGHCAVPVNWNRPAGLGKWAAFQRRMDERGRLLPDRAQRLEAIGFDFGMESVSWTRACASLKSFKEEHGHCQVRPGHPLYAWANKQRRRRREGRLTGSQIAALDGIGFDWARLRRFSAEHEAVWEERFAGWLAFKAKHGHGNVPQTARGEEHGLGLWVRANRHAYRRGQLLPERQRRLEEAGFVWIEPEWRWEQALSALAAFQREHGHCRVPGDSLEHQRLHSWVGVQLRAVREGRMDAERLARLNELGWMEGRRLRPATEEAARPLQDY